MSSDGFPMQNDSDSRRGLAFWLLCLYFFMEYARPQDLIEPLGALRIPMLLSLTLPLLWLRRTGGKLPSDPLLKWYGLFVFLTALGILYAVNHHWIVESTKIALIYLLAVMLPTIAFLSRKDKLALFFRFWIALHVLVALYSLRNQGVGTGSFLQDENDLALTVGMALPYTYFLLQSPRAGVLMKGFCIFAGTVLIGAIIVSGSRGGFLGLLAVTLGIIYFSKHRLRNLLIVAVFGAVAFFMAPQEYWREMETIQNTQDATRNERLYSWGRGWDMFLDNPILGVGAGNFPYRVREYELQSREYDPYTMRSIAGRVSHSLYFTLIPELGLLGIIAFTAMGVGMTRRLREVWRRVDAEPSPSPLDAEMGLLARAMLVSLLGFLVAGAFISVLYYPHFWYLLGFVIALRTAVLGNAPLKQTAPVFGSTAPPVPAAAGGDFWSRAKLPR